MNQSAIPVEILKMTPNSIALKLPFVDIPVTMNYDFFTKRIENGYFLVLRHLGVGYKNKKSLANFVE